MKRFSPAYYLFFIIILCLFIHPAQAQSIGINSDGSAPNTSAMLDVKSTTKGILVPRMSSAQRTAIASPAKGLMVFDNDNSSFWFYNGTAWVQIGASVNYWTQSGNNIYNNNTGFTGIGTTNPLYKLTVVSAPNSYGMVHTDGTTTMGSFIGGGAGGGWIGTQSSHPFNIFTNNGSNQVTFNLDYTTDFNGFGGFKPALNLRDAGGLSGSIEGDGNNLNINALKVQPAFLTPGNLILQLTTGNFSGTNRAGNVGINDPAPVHKLTVRTASSEFGVTHTDGTVYLSTYVGGNYNGGYFGTFSNHPLFFYTNNSGPLMTVATNGNVGIGTINPTYKLSVNGNIRSKEIVVETGWADYVFDENYRLFPLTELEKFIKQNNHLPNIPSAKEIEEKGLEVGDVQKRMMEKIEELSLYIIELNKRIALLEAQSNKSK